MCKQRQERLVGGSNWPHPNESKPDDSILMDSLAEWAPKEAPSPHSCGESGLLRCYVNRVENGDTILSVETLERWTRALDISMSQLFADDGQAAKPLPAFKNRHPK